VTAATVRRLAAEAGGILAAATALALAVNTLSPNGLPVTRPLTLRDLDARYLTAQETKARFDAGQTIFLDARRPDEFGMGHIAGALNFPAEEFTQRFIGLAGWLPKEADIVIYCGAPDCHLARQLADRLAAVGYQQLRIFYHGWREWQARQWPAE
jgi:ArsR family transcriptional regulator